MDASRSCMLLIWLLMTRMMARDDAAANDLSDGLVHSLDDTDAEAERMRPNADANGGGATGTTELAAHALARPPRDDMRWSAKELRARQVEVLERLRSLADLLQCCLLPSLGRKRVSRQGCRMPTRSSQDLAVDEHHDRPSCYLYLSGDLLLLYVSGRVKPG